MAIIERRTQATRPDPPAHLIDVGRYTDRDFDRRERERMWSRTWQLACVQSDVPSIGDYYEYVVGDWSILVVRTASGLRAYHNVCAHRGRPIKTGCGNAGQLQCPYHLWTWNLDGTLCDVPERDTYCEFADEDATLQDVRVEQWKQWIFVNLDQEAAPLADYLRPVTEFLEPYMLDRQYKWWSRSTRVHANWKTVADAFNEAYHARGIHPEAVNFVSSVDYEVRLLGDHSMMIIPFGVPDRLAVQSEPDFHETLDAMEWSFAAFGEDTTPVAFLRSWELEPGQQLRDLMIPLMQGGLAQSGIDVSSLTEGQLVDDWHFHIFPNVIINQFSFGSWLFRFLPDPEDPNYSFIDMWYFHRVPDGDELPPPDPHQVIPEGESCGAVMDQDLRNTEIQQRGLRSPAARPMRLSNLEARIVHMHAVLDRYLAGG